MAMRKGDREMFDAIISDLHKSADKYAEMSKEIGAGGPELWPRERVAELAGNVAMGLRQFANIIGMHVARYR